MLVSFCANRLLPSPVATSRLFRRAAYTTSLQRLAALRVEADSNAERAEASEAKVKKLEQEVMVKDQEIGSLQHKLATAEAELEKLESSLKEHKQAKEESSNTKDTNEGLSRKIALLEEELDNAEKNLRETTDKYVQAQLQTRHDTFAYCIVSVSLQTPPGRCQGRTL